MTSERQRAGKAPGRGRRSDVWRALATTEGAVLLGAAGVTALAISAPWFLALGAAGWGFLAWERFGELRQERGAARYRLPPLVLDGLAEEPRRLAEEGRRAAQAVLSEIAAAPDFTRDLFAVAASEVRELDEKYLSLVRRLDEISRYLAAGDTARLEREQDRVRKRAE